jgi:hypothetical protein
VLDDVKCGSLFNNVLSAISALTIVMFIVFCFLQRLLFTSTNFDSLLPWAQLESNVGILKLGWKLYISFAFMLNKYASMRNELNLVAFSMGAVITFYRLGNSKMYNNRINQATALYEIVATWFFLCIPVHQITKSQLTISTLVVILTSGVLLASLLIYYCDLRHDQILLKFTDNP